MKRLLAKMAYWGAFLSLGPITGFLVEGVYRNLRKGERILAGLYAVSVVTTFFSLPLVLVLAIRWKNWLIENDKGWPYALGAFLVLSVLPVVLLVVAYKRRRNSKTPPA
jgi:uncharacterized membrane protein (DUF485 family)